MVLRLWHGIWDAGGWELGKHLHLTFLHHPICQVPPVGVGDLIKEQIAQLNGHFEYRGDLNDDNQHMFDLSGALLITGGATVDNVDNMRANVCCTVSVTMPWQVWRMCLTTLPRTSWELCRTLRLSRPRCYIVMFVRFIHVA